MNVCVGAPNYISDVPLKSLPPWPKMQKQHRNTVLVAKKNDLLRALYIDVHTKTIFNNVQRLNPKTEEQENCMSGFHLKIDIIRLLSNILWDIFWAIYMEENLKQWVLFYLFIASFMPICMWKNILWSAHFLYT